MICCVTVGDAGDKPDYGGEWFTLAFGDFRRVVRKRSGTLGRGKVEKRKRGWGSAPPPLSPQLEVFTPSLPTAPLWGTRL